MAPYSTRRVTWQPSNRQTRASTSGVSTSGGMTAPDPHAAQRTRFGRAEGCSLGHVQQQPGHRELSPVNLNQCAAALRAKVRRAPEPVPEASRELDARGFVRAMRLVPSDPSLDTRAALTAHPEPSIWLLSRPPAPRSSRAGTVPQTSRQAGRRMRRRATRRRRQTGQLGRCKSVG